MDVRGPFGRRDEVAIVRRSGPSIEVKVVILVAAVIVAQDLLLLGMHLAGARPSANLVARCSVLVLSVFIAAVWGNAIARAIRRLTRACFVAQRGDVNVLSEPTRSDEIGELNHEMNALIGELRSLTGCRSDLAAAGLVTDAANDAAPQALRSSHDLLVSLKELKEGAAAEAAILRKIAGSLGEARTMVGQIAGHVDGGLASDEVADKLRAFRGAAREAEILADAVVDEAARREIDAAALARAVNGLRDAVRTMADVSGQAASLLEQRRADARAAGIALERLADAESQKSDGGWVAELMDRSAARGLSEATRLAATLRKLGLTLEAFTQRRILDR